MENTVFFILLRDDFFFDYEKNNNKQKNLKKVWYISTETDITY